jgi:hypothetical protein
VQGGKAKASPLIEAQAVEVVDADPASPADEVDEARWEPFQLAKDAVLAAQSCSLLLGSPHLSVGSVVVSPLQHR